MRKPLCLLALSLATPAAAQAPLERAIEIGDPAALRHAQPNVSLAYGATPLLLAVEHQDEAAVRILLRAGARVNAADHDGLTPLALACERGGARIIAALLDAHADLRHAGPDGATPLHICARLGPEAAVARMLALGAPVDAADARGQTPLMWAASAGHAQAVAALIKAGAGVNRAAKGGFTPLAFAIKSGAAEPVRLLLAAGADAGWRGPEHTSAAQLAAYQGAWDALTLLIQRGGVDLSARDREGQQLLHRAASAGREDVIALLLAKGADGRGLTGPTTIQWVTEANFGMPPAPVPPTPPLFFAAQAGQVGAMRRLIAAGADPLFATVDGGNLVMAATKSGHAAALDYALSVAPGVDKNAALLMLANGGPQPELLAMVRVLAAHGARADQPDAQGQTPAQIAAKGRSEVAAAFAQVFSPPPIPRADAAQPAPSAAPR